MNKLFVVWSPNSSYHACLMLRILLCRLWQLKKENYELVSDEVQQSAPRNSVVNAASSARRMPAGASTLGNPQVGHLATTQRAVMSPQLMQGAIPGNVMPTHNPMQPSSPSQLAANRMPPPSNAPSRQQIMNNHLGQQGIASNVKPSQIDPAQASQIAAQQQQHHQMQQQVPMQRQTQQQQHLQQHHQQQMVAASQIAQLTGQVGLHPSILIVLFSCSGSSL